jgi:sulfur-carrier protein
VPRLRLLGPARDAAGTGSEFVPGHTVGDVVTEAKVRFGEPLSSLMDQSRIWVNGDEADFDTPVGDEDEVAVIPPVSGGCG